MTLFEQKSPIPIFIRFGLLALYSFDKILPHSLNDQTLQCIYPTDHEKFTIVKVQVMVRLTTIYHIKFLTLIQGAF